ncbi:MAG: hypothetical protein KJ709_07705 [Nanoarchaeota archaeon]|nr:hypothetical protein [Nanoarchaeota archaeon]
MSTLNQNGKRRNGQVARAYLIEAMKETLKGMRERPVETLTALAAGTGIAYEAVSPATAAAQEFSKERVGIEQVADTDQYASKVPTTEPWPMANAYSDEPINYTILKLYSDGVELGWTDNSSAVGIDGKLMLRYGADGKTLENFSLLAKVNYTVGAEGIVEAGDSSYIKLDGKIGERKFEDSDGYEVDENAPGATRVADVDITNFEVDMSDMFLGYHVPEWKLKDHFGRQIGGSITGIESMIKLCTIPGTPISSTEQAPSDPYKTEWEKGTEAFEKLGRIGRDLFN